MKLQSAGSEKILESAGIGPGATDPDIAVMTNGQLVVTWTERLGQPTDEFDDTDGAVFIRVLTADGVPVSDIIQVNTFQPYIQDRPHVVAMAAGSFAIGFTSTLAPGDAPADADTFIKFYAADGRPAGAFTLDINEDTPALNPTTFNQDNLHEIVKLSGNRFAVIQEERHTGTAVQANVYDSSGALQVQLSGPVDDMVQLGNGNILRAGVAPENLTTDQIQLRLHDSQFRAPVGFEGVYEPMDFFIEGSGGHISRSEVELVALAGGGFAIAFVEEVDATNSQIALAVVSDFGQIEGSRIPVSLTLPFDSANAEFDMIGLSGGGIAMAVTVPDGPGGPMGVDILLFDADGSLSTRLQASATDAGNQANPSLAELPDGRIVLAFTDDSGNSDTMRLAYFEVDGRTGKFVGSAGDDVLNGVAGNERILGLAGDDKMSGGGGNDRLFGGDGDDTVKGDAGADALRGGLGADTLIGGNGNDGLGGGDGNDILRGGNGRDVVGGGLGNDRLFGNGGNDVMKGGLGDDRMTGGGGGDTFLFTHGISGDDTITDFNEAVDVLQIDLRGRNASTVDVSNDGTDTLVTFGAASVTLEGVALDQADIVFLFI